jgi:hypothetical protein
MAFGSEMPPPIANHGMDNPQNPDYTGAQSGKTLLTIANNDRACVDGLLPPSMR